MAIQNKTIGTVTESVYTSSGNTAVVVMYICNLTNTSQSFNVFAVPSGGSANANTKIYSDVTLSGKNTFVTDREKMILNNGDSIQANCSAANGVTVTVSYIGI